MGLPLWIVVELNKINVPAFPTNVFLFKEVYCSTLLTSLSERRFCQCFKLAFLIPFKTLTFGNGVNYTAGLNKVRTSPDHGTAYDLAGKGEAKTQSFEEALFCARQIFFNRSAHREYAPA